MKLFLLSSILICCVLGGGFTYLALTDIDIEQERIIQTIGNERFFEAK